MKRIVVAFGTRPEAIKLVPVIQALRSTKDLEAVLVVSGQHREQLDDVLRLFELDADVDLQVMTDRQPLPELVSRIVPLAAAELRRLKPDYVVVQGDTFTTFAIALAAFVEGAPVAHVEAGLRSRNLREPFPEEASRRLTAVLTALHLAPTPGARRNLLEEGVSGDSIVVTGQTAVDAIQIAADRGTLPQGLPLQNLVAVTLHRRENWPHLRAIAAALAGLARSHPEYTFVFPMHRNPVVREAVHPLLSTVLNFRLLEPLDYFSMAALLKASTLIVTDSGGLQEEGVSLGTPVVVVRNTTERPEGIASGGIVLAGTEPVQLSAAVEELLRRGGSNPKIQVRNPYGDGHAAKRVVLALMWQLGLTERPTDWHES